MPIFHRPARVHRSADSPPPTENEAFPGGNSHCFAIREKHMTKLALPLAAALALVAASPVFAAGKSLLVTEEAESGIKNAQGSWFIEVDGEKLSGDATMQLNNGSPLTYKLKGTIKDGVYTVEMSDRSDGKKGCVWTGKAASGPVQSHGFIGKAPCEGVTLVLRMGGA
jgi:hypothetical protein